MLRVLTWNLKHGRAVPPARRELPDEFARALEGWAWDVALLQEVPPWWPAPLAARLGVQQRFVLTSRNSLLALRRTVARRWPDAIKSNGGGCNAILVRHGLGTVAEHRSARLSLLPERRWLHGVRAGDLWFANLHTAASPSQGQRAAAIARAWAGGLPAILGGDFNVRSLSLPGFALAGGSGVDQIFASGVALSEHAYAEVLERGTLSDHAPVRVTLVVS